jgi:hypothetical protein
MQFLSHVPLWVWGLFILLLVLSFLLSLPRDVTKMRAMIAGGGLTVYSAISATMFFNGNLTGAMCWVFGVGLSLVIGANINLSKDITLNKTGFHMAGGYFVPVLIMSIFAMRFIASAIAGYSPMTASSTIYIGIFSLIYGVLSGLFLSRFLTMIRLANV